MSNIFFGILSENIVMKNINKWIEIAGIPDVFVEKDENLAKYTTKLLDKYNVVSLNVALARYPDADIWVTYPKAGITRQALIDAGVLAAKIHLLEDRRFDPGYRALAPAARMNGKLINDEIPNITSEFLSMIKLPDENCKMLNYLLVIPAIPRMASGRIASGFVFQIGIAYLSSALKASGRKLFTINLGLPSVNKPYDLLKDEIIKNKIDVVMTGGLNSQFQNLKMIVDIAKNINPNIITILGGIIITADPISTMEAFENADYGVIGEGEITINSLAYALETDDYTPDIEGIVFRQNNQWVAREKYPTVHDLSILPYPDYEGFNYGEHLDNAVGQDKRIFINTSRSCLHRCTFCFNKHGKYRRLQLDDVFKLIDWVLSLYPDAKRLHMGDELSFSKPEYAIEFSHRIKPYKINWQCTLRVDRVNKEMLVAMKDSGCRMAVIGIESADNNVLKSMRKGLKIEQVEKVLAVANEIGFKMFGFLIFGDPEETMDSVLRSIKWYMKHRKNVENMVVIRIDPGSHLYDIACERGLIANKAEYIKDYKITGSKLINLSKLTESEFKMLPHLLKAVMELETYE